MDFKYAYICLFVCSLYKFGQTEIACGHLKVVYEYKANSVDCRIRLYPSNELKPFIEESHHYRWIVTRNISSSTVSEIILQKNSDTFKYNKTKYNEEDYTLLIRNLNPLDVGRYEVECWTRQNIFYNSDKVMVILPEPPTHTPGSKPTASSLVADSGIGSTAIIVTSICAVVIVAIISGIVYLVFCKQRGGNQGTKRLVSDEGTSATGQEHHVCHEDPLSMYNEIDTGELVLDYAKVEKMQVNPVHGLSKEMFVASQQFHTGVAIASDEGEYDLVNVNDAFVGETDNVEVEYADILVDLPDTAVKAIEAEEENNYEYVKTATRDETILNIHDSKKDTVENETKDMNLDAQDKNINADVYAKVSKNNSNNEEIIKIGNCDTEKLYNMDYSIQFPRINCSEITMSLDEDRTDQQAEQCQEPVMYSNLVPRPHRDKTRASRASRRELQYAVLDLPDQDLESDVDKEKELIIHAKFQPCHYDAIDFDRKAFIPPIRKAPSSWYRRKKQKGKTMR
ncbi:uncharacterized protein LOC132742420 [Ruditapes philippinarum]|uniref:uncharacterized protein LOC132742420 n=1 Tax=Ruditapes philippinarum TaxID=129788 RepID=UPI00295A8C75|nr:uncharacterized protein LOC132742420 [Ruditapes philippinarum]